MQENIQKEEMSLAYIHAVSAQAGFDFRARVGRDIASEDGEIRSDEAPFAVLGFQAKATARDVVRDNHVRFDLNLKNYNDLRASTGNPRILILVTLPSSVQDWARLSDDQLCLQGRGYWLSLRGREASSNLTTVAVHVPRTNRFDAEQLSVLMARSLEEWDDAAPN